jgi:DNA polymerase-3 subunit alpha
VEAPEAIGTLRAILARAAEQGKTGLRGPIVLTLMAPDLPGEVDLELGDRLPVSPQLRGALKAVGGVIEVEELGA